MAEVGPGMAPELQTLPGRSAETRLGAAALEQSRGSPGPFPMHVRELLELAILAAVHGRTFIRCAGPLSATSQQQYWSASKFRLQRWMLALKEHSARTATASSAGRRDSWGTIRPVLEEILLSEILTRVWTAIVCGHDARRGLAESGPVVRSVLVGHTEARFRSLNLMLQGQGLSVEEAVALNRLRRRAERWTDVLLAFLVPEAALEEVAFDSRRAIDFAEDSDLQTPNSPGFEILLASLRNAFRTAAGGPSPNADLNQEIAGGVLACFSPDLFDSAGMLHSHWLWWRLTNVTADTQGMLNEMLYLDGEAAPLPPGDMRPTDDAERRLRF